MNPTTRGRGRPKIYTEEEAKQKRIETQKRIREERKMKEQKWIENTPIEQKDLITLLKVKTCDGEALDKIKELLNLLR